MRLPFDLPFRYHINTEGIKSRATEIQKQYMILKKDRSNILLQTKDASQKAIEQQKKAKEISGNLDDLLQTCRVQAPYTSSWKSEEALNELASLKARLKAINTEAAAHDIGEEQIEGFNAKTKELEENLETLYRIWNINSGTHCICPNPQSSPE